MSLLKKKPKQKPPAEPPKKAVPTNVMLKPIALKNDIYDSVPKLNIPLPPPLPPLMSTDSEAPYIQRKPKAEPGKRDSEKEFLRLFKDLTYAHSPWEVWADFVAMSACSVSNAVDKSHYDEREERYMRTIKKYSKNEQNIFPALLAEVVFALDLNPEQDFLGKLYMTLNLSNHFKGQFFTPYHVSQLMAALSLDDIMPRVKELGYITIHDSCCGGGSTLIAGINEARKILDKEGLSFQNHILVTGQDIDETVALMCYIQVSLLGLAGFFKVGNSFTEPMTYGETQKNYWFTPMYFSSVWRTRRIIKKVTELFEEKEDIVNVQDKSDDSQLEG